MRDTEECKVANAADPKVQTNSVELLVMVVLYLSWFRWSNAVKGGKTVNLLQKTRASLYLLQIKGRASNENGLVVVEKL